MVDERMPTHPSRKELKRPSIWVYMGQPKIISTKTVLGGKKRIAGTRISVDLIYNYIKDDAIDRISQDYPHLKNNQIQAALDYLGQQIHKSKERLVAASA